MQLVKILKITPIGKPRMNHSDAWRKPPRVQRYWEYKDKLRGMMRAEELPVPYLLLFVVPMPKSWSKRKKALMRFEVCESKPDKDNAEKAFLDALFDEDKQITDGRVAKIWGDEGEIRVFKIAPLPHRQLATQREGTHSFLPAK